MKKITIFIGYFTQEPTIDANTHPEIQEAELLKLISDTSNSELEIFTNSIYVINKLTVLQGYHRKGVTCPYFGGFLGFEIDVMEVTKSGEYIKVPKYKDMMSDDNLLNNWIDKSNQEYSEILINYNKLRKSDESI